MLHCIYLPATSKHIVIRPFRSTSSLRLGLQPCNKCLLLLRLTHTEFEKSAGKGLLLLLIQFNIIFICILFINLLRLRILFLFIAIIIWCNGGTWTGVDPPAGQWISASVDCRRLAWGQGLERNKV